MTGKLKNCPGCGKLFMDMGKKICPDCIQKELEDEDKAAAYVREHPNAHVKEIVEETGVKEKIIMKMLREGRFKTSSGVPITYPCERCGKPITIGRFCDSCSKSIVTEVKQFQQKQATLHNVQKRGSTPADNHKGSGMYSRDMTSRSGK